MSDTGFEDDLLILPNRAAGYSRKGEEWRNAAFIDPSFVYAAGALYSTVDDLLAWNYALHTGEVLKPESLQAMRTDYGHRYGLGLNIDHKWGRDWIYHTGEIDGFASQLHYYPDAHLTVVALFNELTPPAKLAADLGGLCLKASVYPRQIAESRTNLQRYAGYYETDEASVLKIEPRDGVLATRNFQEGDTHLYPQGGGKFFARTFGIEVAFQSAADGHVTGLLLTPQGSPQPLAYKRLDAAEGERLLAIPLAERIATAFPKRAAAAKAAAEAAAAKAGSSAPK